MLRQKVYSNWLAEDSCRHCVHFQRLRYSGIFVGYGFFFLRDRGGVSFGVLALNLRDQKNAGQSYVHCIQRLSPNGAAQFYGSGFWVIAMPRIFMLSHIWGLQCRLDWLPTNSALHAKYILGPVVVLASSGIRVDIEVLYAIGMKQHACSSLSRHMFLRVSFAFCTVKLSGGIAGMPPRTKSVGF